MPHLVPAVTLPRVLFLLSLCISSLCEDACTDPIYWYFALQKRITPEIWQVLRINFPHCENHLYFWELCLICLLNRRQVHKLDFIVNFSMYERSLIPVWSGMLKIIIKKYPLGYFDRFPAQDFVSYMIFLIQIMAKSLPKTRDSLATHSFL